MFNKRVRILVIIVAALLGICVLRMADIQLLSNSFYKEQVKQLRIQSGAHQQIRTLRGRILDRKGEVLAADEPRFWLSINYGLSRYLDERVRQAMALAAVSKNPDANTKAIEDEFEQRLNELEAFTAKCVQFGMSREEVVLRLQKINERIWNLRTFFAWARNRPSPDLLKKYNRNLSNIPFSEAMEDFEKKFPDPRERLILTGKVDDIAEAKQAWPVVELMNEDAVFAARVEFLEVSGIEVTAKGERVYPYGSAAAQTIGWVGPPSRQDKEKLAGDRLSSYLNDELCGREDGVEYVCEPILRGRRGELVYDIDKELISQTEAQYGQDVRLAIDIELQQKIEQHIADCMVNTNCKSPTAAVVLDVNSGDILAIVSLPSFDLNLVRRNYGEFVNDPCEPLRNRAINEQYPPGSVIKPVILIAGLEAGKVTAGEAIECPSQRAPQGWPNCLIFLRNHVGHDTVWTNTARNAIKGSCNIYFSHLANRIDELTLQSWLYRFGYGHKSLLDSNDSRDFRQAQGLISNTRPDETISSFEQLPLLESGEKRWFGIGQGNLRVTPLQVANAIRTIARGGKYSRPRLLADPCSQQPESINLNVSTATLAAVCEGMRAVVEESGGTANREFAGRLAYFAARGIKIYGKTGSTTNPEHAWFAGFARDGLGKAVAVSVIVEGGQQGSSDAAPLARDILQFCVETGYLGR